MELITVYEKLLERYGKQNWWPINNGFSPPEWEVCVGAILTQNTNWRNVEKALANLKAGKVLSPADIIATKSHDLEDMIRPSGFFRQKAARLKHFSEFVLGFGGFGNFSQGVTREQLLEVKGLGPETADSILLYAIGRPYFVIDAYTRRVFNRLGFRKKPDYESWRRFFEEGIPRDPGIYMEFHALIVEIAKNQCKKTPICSGCALGLGCRHNAKEKAQKADKPG